MEEVIPSVLSYFQENNLILKWFFIRYSDPKPHLRIRFLLINSKEYNNILNYIHNVLDTYVESGEINNIQLDTYKRELERYGYKTIEDAESLFNMNSELTLDYLHLNDDEKIIIILFYIDRLLSQIGLSVNEKLQWIKDYNTSFKEEFNADKNLNQQLDKKYRAFSPKFLDFSQSLESKEFRDLILENLHLSNDALENICNSYDKDTNPRALQLFFQSIFHMAINRMFISQQRLFEMIIYDYLHRYYKTLSYSKQNGEL
ncbi:thiopeptide-type bacteriocin biosynthesis protein [Elizabethkingia bruuniana]|nr:thiopeptide-type bacteriocin biosynthesis protein [Elizabethkingia bruuniana]